MSLDYGNILARAWQITWKHKVLWIFGILAGLGSGGGGGPNVNYQLDSRTGNLRLPPEFERLLNRFDEPTWIAIAIGLVCLGLLISLVFIALSVIGRGGLISGIRLANAQGSVTFGEAWQAGLSKFWTLFLIGLLTAAAGFLLALIIIGPGILLTVATFGIGVLCLLPLICVFVILVVILSIIAYFAQIAAVVENLGVMDALRRAWAIIQANLASIVILGLILLVIGFVVGIVLALPAFFLFFPAVLGAAGLAGDSQNLATFSLAFALICCALYVPILLVLNGILQTWTTSVWTLAYGQFTRPATSGSQPAPQITV